MIVILCVALFVCGLLAGLGFAIRAGNREAEYWRDLYRGVRDEPRDTVTVDGITISAQCFKWFTSARPGDLFRYIERDGDGVVTVQTVRSEALCEYDKAVN